mmetsp:Transcript_4778/g.6991  ORF Transcript_4778/g.6991 Transcript_4778/m.6991 type:complete len:691 (+) Transcript_4778:191-2263(+)
MIRQGEYLKVSRHVYSNLKKWRTIGSSSHSALQSSKAASFASAAKQNQWGDTAKGLMGLLSDQQRSLLQEQRTISQATLDLASNIGGITLQHCESISPILREILTPHGDTDTQALADRSASASAFETTFSIVIAGEFNAGKSTLINALLGKKILETGSLPTTDCLHVITHKNGQGQPSPNMKGISSTNNDGAITTTSHANAIVLHCIDDVPLLNDLTLVDTPGTNAIADNHTTRTLKLLPTADLILFVTSADRPFPKSERKLLQSIQLYRKNIVIVINKMDILDATGGNHGFEEKQKIVEFVADNAADLLGARAVIYPISSRDALAAKLIHGKDDETSKVWKRSNFSSLEKFLKETLTEEAKVQAKMLNPLGVTEGVLSECRDVLKKRKRDLESDTATVNLLQHQMDSWKNEMESDIQYFRDDVKNLMTSEMNQCQNFIESMGTIEMYSLLLFGDQKSLESRWDQSKDATLYDGIVKELLNLAGEYSDSVATSSRAQGQDVIEYLGKRPAVVGQNLIGSVSAASRFEDTRKSLYDELSRAFRNVFSSHNAEAEKQKVLKSLKNGIYVSSTSYVLALSTGTSVSLGILDSYTGSAAAATFAIIGASVLPYFKNQVISEYRSNWEGRDKKVAVALTSICAKEIQRIHKRIASGVKPYTRYVTTEAASIVSFDEECEALSNSTLLLRNRIVKI